MRNKTLFFLLLLLQNSFAQVNKNFIEHLVYNNLNTEHATYLKSFEQKNLVVDSLKYYKVKFDLLTNNYNNLDVDFLKCSVCAKDLNLTQYLSSKLLLNNYDAGLKLILEGGSQGAYQIKNTLLFKAVNLINTPDSSSFTMPYYLNTHYNEYKTFTNKKAWKAGLLSAIIPGAGKLYIGRPNSFWGSFLSNAFYLINLTESISKKGITNGYTIFSAGVFSVFYFPNIFGTIYDLKRVKLEKKKHFLYEVADYQLSGITLY